MVIYKLSFRILHMHWEFLPVHCVSYVDDLREALDLHHQDGEHEDEGAAVDDEAEPADHQPSEDAADHPVAPSVEEMWH